MAYRLKHLPTGLYYTPSRDVVVRSLDGTQRWWVKSNLSKTGKLYLTEAKALAPKSWGGKFYDHTILAWDERGVAHPALRPMFDDGWKVEDV